ncbi:intersectin-EH binding protein Ibp1 [Mycobacterium sp. TNTM28]|uniref:Intersectin-EH binding protein Ibp1 n=1 Tax=[Mycobacterium] fortunisiensis TaxID=2600579 RepID=A0ABS6KHU2_9MYCO|nr:intersectin-EH binding protein Ibp1 [[Mycobacterium] fortunisiensis]MBU9763156.1 intersectin-EH binding protein Ibp1 [[Mycobacterium] fortunisiensis]
MATFPTSMRRLILACGFTVAAAAAPAITLLAVPTSSSPAIACPSGEEEDLYTGTCVPHTVPNSPAPFSSIPGNPNLPAVNLPGGGGAIPCTGANSGECIGLAEEAQSEGPQAVPRSSVGSSPTVTGHIG